MELQNSLVSIIIPVYNVSDYIERCIKSVMNQTYTDIECIIVDDATPDDSIAKCEQMIAAYDGPIQFSILHHQKNRGLSAARNTGTDAATSEYLYYLDSDDEITPDCIETLMQPIKEDPSLELVQGVRLDVCEGHESVSHKIMCPLRITRNEIAYDEYYKYKNLQVYATNKLIRRSFLLKNKLYFKIGIIHEDFLWMFYVIQQLSNAYLCSGVTYIYRIRLNSITSEFSGKESARHFLLIFQIVFNNLKKGMENVELNSVSYLFCRFYCKYKNELPEYKKALVLYRKRAKRFGCLSVYFKLWEIWVLCQLCNPVKMKKRLKIG